MIKSSFTMECTEPMHHLNHKFLNGDMVNTWSMTLLFQLVEGLLQCCLLSTDVWSPLKWLWYFLIHAMLMLSLLKCCWIFWIVFTCVLPCFWQNLMQHCCWSRSFISQQMKIWQVLATLTHWLTTSDWLTVGGEIFMHVSQFSRIQRLCWSGSHMTNLGLIPTSPFMQWWIDLGTS